MSTQAPSGQLAVIAKNILNLYAEPDSDSEMVTQAILGQTAWIEAGQDEWSYITTWDGFHGWALSRWVRPRLDGTHYSGSHSVARVRALFTNVFISPDDSSDILTKAVITSELEIIEMTDEWVKVVLPDGQHGHVHHSHVRLIDRAASNVIVPPSGDQLVTTAKRFISVPYLWGGTSPFGLDCSGFTQLVYHVHGVTLLRNSYMQATDERSHPLESDSLRAGDLVFFAGGQDRERITHVGMAIGGGRFIHAASWAGVIVTDLDEPRYRDIHWGARRFRCKNWEEGCPSGG